MPQGTTAATAKASQVRKIAPMLLSDRTLSSTTTTGIFAARWNSSTVSRPISQIVFFFIVQNYGFYFAFTNPYTLQRRRLPVSPL